MTKISINNSVRRVFTIVTNVRTYVVVGEILLSVQEIMWYYKKQCTSIVSTEDAKLLVKRIHHKANRLKAENITAQTQWGQRRKTCMRWSKFSLCIPFRQRHLSSSASQRSFFGFSMNQLEKEIYILQETKIRINVNRNEVMLLTRVSPKLTVVNKKKATGSVISALFFILCRAVKRKACLFDTM